MKKSGILRLITIFLMCLTIIFYNFKFAIKEEKNINIMLPSTNYFWNDEGIIEEKTEENSSVQETKITIRISRRICQLR